MDPCLIVSPHLDDAVLSLGQFMAGRPDTTVLTVFAGRPEDDERVLTTFDRDSGFTSAREALDHRIDEDTEALTLLQARAVRLNYIDGQYGEQPTVWRVRDSIQRVVDDIKPEMVLVPLGIEHPDHILVARACEELTCGTLWAYEELPNRVVWPERVCERLARLRETGWLAALEFVGTGDAALKRAAIARYRSQLWAVDVPETRVGERVWRLWRA